MEKVEKNNNSKKGKVSLLVKTIILSFLIIIFVTFIFLKNNIDFCEWWTSNFTSTYVLIFGTFNKYIPFSITEILLIGLGIFCIVSLVFLFIHLFKSRYKKSLHKLLNISLVVFSILATYQLTAEMAYNRKPLNLSLYEEKVEKEDFEKIVDYFISDLNKCCDELSFNEQGEIISPYSVSELNELIAKEYEKLSLPYLSNFTNNCKPMLTSFIYREFHITGVTFLPLGEPNINTLNVEAGKPTTFAHELAHTKGAMREEDADLIATYLCLHSSNPYIRYSGYYASIGSMLKLMNYLEGDNLYRDKYMTLDIRFRKNLSYASSYWKEHNKAQEFGNFWNDLYLKMSGVKEGTSSYGDSETIVDDKTKEIISFSSYQKLYFSLYFAN